MRRVMLIASIWLFAAASALAQSGGAWAPGAAPAKVDLTVDAAVKMAIDNNPDLAAARLDPQIGDTQVAAASGAFKPVFSTGFRRNNQVDPPANFLLPIATRTNAMTTDVGVNQRLPWFGTSYNVAWNAVHTTSNSFLNSYNPLVQSGLSLNISQPLLRNFAIDDARLQLATSRIDRATSATRLREAVVRTTAAVKTAYWNLTTAIANVDARKSALDLALELVRVNKVKVDVGQAPPLDLVAAQAEVAADQEQVIIAEAAVKTAEDQLRALIFDTRDRSAWNVKLQPVDAPLVGLVPIDLDGAMTAALRDRADLVRARNDIDRTQTDVKFTENQRLPDVRLDVNYLASGLGGTQVLRTNDFPGTILGEGGVTGFGSVLNQLLTGRYSTWAVGVNINYPVGHTTQEAQHARAKLERAQAQQRLRSAESRAVRQVRQAFWNIEMNVRRVETSRAARELATQRLDAERKRLDVGKSTSFLVIQAQRDLAQARTNELAAILAYDLALVDFEALQQAGPLNEQTDAPTPVSPQSPGAARPVSTPPTPVATATIPGISGR